MVELMGPLEFHSSARSEAYHPACAKNNTPALIQQESSSSKIILYCSMFRQQIILNSMPTHRLPKLCHDIFTHLRHHFLRHACSGNKTRCRQLAPRNQ